jgi:hypothetical protein
MSPPTITFERPSCLRQCAADPTNGRAKHLALPNVPFGLGVPSQPFGQQVQARLARVIIVFAPLAQTDSVAGLRGLEPADVLVD